VSLAVLDRPVDANAANAAVTAGRAGTLQAAQESMTLLRNQNNTLPLSSSAKVVVTGPSADSMTNQLGGWSVSWQGVFGAGHVCCMGPPDQIPPGTTVQEGIRNDDSNAEYVPDGDTAAHTAADAFVVAVGEKAYAEGLGDNPAPQLPPEQKAEIKALEDTGKPVIVPARPPNSSNLARPSSRRNSQTDIRATMVVYRTAPSAIARPISSNATTTKDQIDLVSPISPSATATRSARRGRVCVGGSSTANASADRHTSRCSRPDRYRSTDKGGRDRKSQEIPLGRIVSIASRPRSALRTARATIRQVSKGRPSSPCLRRHRAHNLPT
jgi:Glycosyl hydrolase family 3 C-terminal domain